MCMFVHNSFIHGYHDGKLTFDYIISSHDLSNVHCVIKYFVYIVMIIAYLLLRNRCSYTLISYQADYISIIHLIIA